MHLRGIVSLNYHYWIIMLLVSWFMAIWQQRIIQRRGIFDVWLAVASTQCLNGDHMKKKKLRKYEKKTKRRGLIWIAKKILPIMYLGTKVYISVMTTCSSLRCIFGCMNRIKMKTQTWRLDGPRKILCGKDWKILECFYYAMGFKVGHYCWLNIKTQLLPYWYFGKI